MLLHGRDPGECRPSPVEVAAEGEGFGPPDREDVGRSPAVDRRRIQARTGDRVAQKQPVRPRDEGGHEPGVP